MKRVLISCTLSVLVALLIVSKLLAADDRKVIIPFDFVSKFDKGRYGQMMGEMFWKKIAREKSLLTTESVMDVRDYCANNDVKPTPDTDLATMKKYVREDFGAHIGIWGSIERAPGEEVEIYDLVIKCVDFSGDEPKVLYDVKATTNSAGEIGHVYAKNLLNKLCDRKAAGPAGTNPVAEENWKTKPNLLADGFERGISGVPKSWSKVCGQAQDPLGQTVRWTTEEGNPKNHVIRFNVDRETAETYGLMYYSDYFPVQEGATYRFQCRFRTQGPALKVFIKCYDDEATTYRSESEGKGKSSTDAKKLGRDAKLPDKMQRREVYRSQEPLCGAGANWKWQTHTEDFTPKHTKFSPKWGRVMLFAYIVPGMVEFDDVVVKQVVPAEPITKPKVRRHSTDSEITIEEMERNERHSQELKAKAKDDE
jgi:hypothetical protein